jgi:prepilin-type processing-associated H-X9-DG protein
MELYLASNKLTYPAAYVYTPPPSGWNGRADEYTDPTYGYTHWSSFLLAASSGSTSAAAFTCPSVYNNGLPPTDPMPGLGDYGQIFDPANTTNTPDVQVPRCAYTLNEAVCTRNKFVTFDQPNPIRDSAQSIQYAEQYVRTSRITDSSTTILATEFWGDWHFVVDPNNITVCKSHRTVSGYQQLLNGGTDLVAGLQFFSASAPSHQRVTSVSNPPPALTTPGAPPSNSLGWVGRNHGVQRHDSLGHDLRKTNFLYCDGHVETKVIEDTLNPFQWGDPYRIWSVPGAVVQQ